MADDAELNDTEIESTEPNPSDPERAQLEAEAAHFLGEGQAPPPAKEEGSEAETPEATTAPEGQVAKDVAKETAGTAQAEVLSDEEKALLNDIRTIKAIDGTPFKGGVNDLVKAWKEASAEIQRRAEKLKPVETQADLASTDPVFKQYIDQATQMYLHPELRAPYLNQAANQMPDPRQYDLNDPEQYKSWAEAQTAFLQRQLDERVNARFSGYEQQQMMEKNKLLFRQRFPDVDPESFLDRAKELATRNPLENIYKALMFDELESRAMEKAQKAVAEKIKVAQTTATPQTSAPPPQKHSLDDIVNYVIKHGSEAAYKRFGREKVEDAERTATEQVFS